MQQERHQRTTLPRPNTAIRFMIAGRPSLLGASDVEPDALRQRQLTRVVDGAGLAASAERSPAAKRHAALPIVDATCYAIAGLVLVHLGRVRAAVGLSRRGRSLRNAFQAGGASDKLMEQSGY
jgi:hypothetical protein